MAERFQVITSHGEGGLSTDPGYVGVERSSDAVLVQVLLNAGRDDAIDRRFSAGKNAAQLIPEGDEQ